MKLGTVAVPTCHDQTMSLLPLTLYPQEPFLVPWREEVALSQDKVEEIRQLFRGRFITLISAPQVVLTGHRHQHSCCRHILWHYSITVTIMVKVSTKWRKHVALMSQEDIYLLVILVLPPPPALLPLIVRVYGVKLI